MTVDLTTRYLGLELKNPLVISASPLTGNLDTLRRLEEAGAAAAVFPSLFEEQIEHDEMQLHQLYQYNTESFAESLTYFPEMEDYNTGPSFYLHRIEQARHFTSMPLIGSLNGCSSGGWVRYARWMEDAGAHAIELNIYFVPTDPGETGPEIEKRYIELVAKVRQSIKIPLAVKIGAQFSSLPHLAQQLVAAGADGLVLFNRYLEPDINLDTLEFTPDLVLSNKHELRLPLRWIAILRDQVPISLAATSGIQGADDMLKALLAGADVAMMASVLLRQGVSWLGTTLNEMRTWLEEKEYESIKQLKGSMSRGRCSNPGDLERANYMKALVNYSAQHTV